MSDSIPLGIYVAMNMEENPIVLAACICENVIFDKQDVASLIRIVDTWTVEVPDNMPSGLPIGFPVTIFLRLYFGKGREDGVISIQSTRPDGTQGSRQNIPVKKAQTQNIQIKTAFHVLNPKPGTYWFVVSWNDKPVTKIPASVILKQTEAPGAARQA